MRIIAIYNCILLITLQLISGCESREFKTIVPSISAGTAASVGSVSFEAEWNSFPQVDYYVLEVSSDPEFKIQVDDMYPLSLKDTIQLVSGLNPETYYYFRISAYTISGTFINYSEPSSVKTLKLSKPLAYEAIEENVGQVRATWSPVDEADGYQLQLAEDINFEFVVRSYDKTNQQDTVQLIDSLQINRPYFYRVRAQSNKGEFVSDYSNIVFINTFELAQPQIQEPDIISNTSVWLAWQTEGEASSYHLEIGTDPLFQDASAIAYSVELTTNALEIPDLTPNITYYARVQSREGTLFSPYSDVIVFTTPGLEAPANLAVSASEQESLIVNWEAVTDAESYEVDVAEDSLFRTVLPAYNAYTVNTEKVTLTGLTPGKTFFVRVRGYGFSSYSEFSTIKTSTKGLDAPRNIAVQNRMLNEFTLVWDEAKGAVSYLLDVATDANFTNILTGYDQKGVFSASAEVSGLSADKSYYVRITSKHSDVVSDTSEPVEVSAAIPQTCVITERSWEDGWTERYQYNNGFLVQIEGDSAGVTTSRYRWEIQWQDNGFPGLAEKYTTDAGGNMLLRETWEYAYSNGKWTSLHLKNAVSSTLELIQLSYDDQERLIAVSSFADAAATVLNYQENYFYQDGQIAEAYDGTDELIRRWKYSNTYNPEYLLSKEIHVLFRNPGNDKIWGHVPAEAISVYEFFNNEGVQRRTYVQDNNTKGMPVKVFTGEIQTTITYGFQSCGF